MEFAFHWPFRRQLRFFVVVAMIPAGAIATKSAAGSQRVNHVPLGIMRRFLVFFFLSKEPRPEALNDFRTMVTHLSFDSILECIAVIQRF